MPLIEAICRDDPPRLLPPPRKAKRREQWLQFQKVWLANLRKQILGTEDEFGNPHGESKLHTDHPKILLPDLSRNDDADGLPLRTLILDLDETLVHTEFDQTRGWITHRRPGVEAFLKRLSTSYEIICFTSGLKPYASPIIDQLDPPPSSLIAHRLYREHTLPIQGMHVKDLSRLNRDLRRTILVDNSPESYLLQPENAIPMKPFFGDAADDYLSQLAPLLEDIVRNRVPDVRRDAFDAARAGSVLKRCHLRGRFAQDAAASASKPAAGRAPRSSKVKPGAKSAGPHSTHPAAPMAPMPDRRVSDLGLVSGGCGSDWGHDGGADGVCGPSYGAEGVGVVGGEEAPRGRERHVLHRGLSDGGIPAPASVATAHSAPQTTSATVAALSAAGRGEDVALREGGLAWGGEVEESALVAWSAVHGAFADVLRGMSPPASTLLPGSEGPPTTDLDDV